MICINLKVTLELYNALKLSPNMTLTRSQADGPARLIPDYSGVEGSCVEVFAPNKEICVLKHLDSKICAQKIDFASTIPQSSRLKENPQMVNTVSPHAYSTLSNSANSFVLVSPPVIPFSNICAPNTNFAFTIPKTSRLEQIPQMVNRVSHPAYSTESNSANSFGRIAPPVILGSVVLKSISGLETPKRVSNDTNLNTSSSLQFRPPNKDAPANLINNVCTLKSTPEDTSSASGSETEHSVLAGECENFTSNIPSSSSSTDSVTLPENVCNLDGKAVSSNLTAFDSSDWVEVGTIHKKGSIDEIVTSGVILEPTKRKPKIQYPRQCKECNKVCRIKGTYYKHIKTCGIIKPIKKAFGICLKCGEKFIDEMSYKIHMESCKEQKYVVRKWVQHPNYKESVSFVKAVHSKE